jgi:topoisomerase-4 subunit A
MYVVLDRALPFIGDGLKPVQRRIIYAMSELGWNAAGAKPKKSARTVGDVIGKFHPHGDSACYEAHGADGAAVLVPLPADRRPGQLRLAGRSEVVRGDALHRIQADADRRGAAGRTGPGHGGLGPNFDGTLEEPTWLPARLPHLLLNGTTGIAVGMATDIPPHNLQRVVSACMRLLDDPDATVRELCEHVPRPGLPTEAEIITPAADLQAMYETGNGSVRARAVYTREGTATSSSPRCPTRSARARSSSRSPADARQEAADGSKTSATNPTTRTRPASCWSRVPTASMPTADGHLFATTDLEKSYRVNLNVIGLDGRPQVKNLKHAARRMAAVPQRHGHPSPAPIAWTRSSAACTCWKACWSPSSTWTK